MLRNNKPVKASHFPPIYKNKYASSKSQTFQGGGRKRKFKNKGKRKRYTGNNTATQSQDMNPKYQSEGGFAWEEND
jgi:hypothetical protein